jgi:hypothetical protein
VLLEALGVQGGGPGRALRAGGRRRRGRWGGRRVRRVRRAGPGRLRLRPGAVQRRAAHLGLRQGGAGRRLLGGRLRRGLHCRRIHHRRLVLVCSAARRRPGGRRLGGPATLPVADPGAEMTALVGRVAGARRRARRINLPLTEPSTEAAAALTCLARCAATLYARAPGRTRAHSLLAAARSISVAGVQLWCSGDGARGNNSKHNTEGSACSSSPSPASVDFSAGFFHGTRPSQQAAIASCSVVGALERELARPWVRVACDRPSSKLAATYLCLVPCSAAALASRSRALVDCAAPTTSARTQGRRWLGERLAGV